MKKTNAIARAAALVLTACASFAAMAAVKFAPVDPTWSVPLILTTNSTAGVYCPVSVIAKSSSGVTFACGVTNDATSSATVPAISLKVKDSGGTVVKTYSFSSGKSVPGRSCIWVGGYAPSGLTSLAAGNYALEATLVGSETKLFRFAIRDVARSVSDAFTGAWSSITTKSGNDFASPPFAAGSAESGFGSGDVATVQFGPYAPMDGIIEYKPGSDKGSLDIVFLVDFTGSMGGCINGLKANIQEFFRSLVEGDEAIKDWRARVVGYQDITCDAKWYWDHDFTTNVTEFCDQINELYADGGGDWPESLLDALWRISKETAETKKFREDATRVVVAFTDAPYKTPMTYPGRCGSTDSTAADAGKAAADAKIILKLIASHNDAAHFNDLVSNCYSTNSTYTYTYSLGTFTGSADTLRNLAKTVSSVVTEADVVEPLLSAKITGPGILSYEWRNVSSADTNNTFTFKVSGLSDSYDTCAAATSGTWTKKTYELDEGTYTCQWFYKKLGYDGNLLDFGQVRRIEWIVATAAPTVTATDGTQSGNVTVTWSMPSDALKVKSYEVSRSEKGATAKTELGRVTTTSYVDSSAVPGVDYTYYVRALNDAGFGEYGSDNGWRGVTLTLSPSSLSFGYAGETKSVTVGSNASWTIAATSGSLTATALTGSINVTADKNTALSSRTGSVTVRAGTTAHNVTKTVSVSQAKRPANLVKLEIVGGERALEGGEGTTFTAVATFEDGTTNVVTTTTGWSITSGSKYGTIGAHTGVLTTGETTDTDGRLTVHATYTYAGSETVTKTAEVEVQIGFTKALLKPVSIVISGDDAIAVGETKPYRALVTYNDKTVEERTLSASALWSVTPASPKATVEKGSAAAMLSAYTGGITLSLQVAYTEAGATVSASKAVTVPAPITIPVAVDVEDPSGAKLYPLEFTTAASGTANVWYGQAAVSHDGTDAARSGRIFGAGTNSISTTVNEAGTLFFWWKVSSESIYDKFTFYVDGAPKAAISGTTGDWREMTFPVSAGTHTFTWEYAKDGKNDEGLDAAFVDMVRWVKLTPPAAPAVTASDGTDDTAVDIRWTKPDSSREILGYRVERSRPDGSARVVLAEDIVTTGWTDATAEPGLDYVYYVCAKNEAGYGEYGSDAGWRGVSLKVDPSELAFSGKGGEIALSVESNAPWEIAAGDTWLAATATGDATAKVGAGENPSLDARDGTVAVTAAGATDHPKSIDISVTEAGRPPKIDVGFVAPYQDWRTKMQITPADTEDEVYNPVSVFLTSDNLEISFGWTNKSEVAIGVPAIRFKLFRPGEAGDECIYEWTDGCKGARILADGTLLPALPTGTSAWSGTLAADILKVLSPGDYMIEAEIGVDADDIDMSDNFAVFRFAVRDPALKSGEAIFTEAEGWSHLSYETGNDFAQAPHLAQRTLESGDNAVTVQFGPYVPMNGFNGRTTTSKKQPLDLVILLDYTGSMGNCIAGLVNNIGNFIDQLLVGDPDNGIDPIEDIRIKIVGFNDIENASYANWFDAGSFTSDRAVLKAKLSQLRRDCGWGWANDGESCYDALYYICKGLEPSTPGNVTAYKTTSDPFRPLGEAARAVILFTDEPPHIERSGFSAHAAACNPLTFALLDAAVKESGVNLTIVGDGEYGARDGYRCGYKHSVFVGMDPENRELIETGGYGSLAKFTKDVDKLKGLAKTVASKVAVAATVVEPVFEAHVQGGGTFSFDWNNDSRGGEKNTFSFVCEGVTNMTLDADTGWQHVELSLGEGLHIFKWNYGKLDYEGDATDCGIVANPVWDPWKTELEVSPTPAEVDYFGTPVDDSILSDESNIVFKVECNSIWKVVDAPDWVSVEQGSGSGDGELIVKVEKNTTFAERVGFVTVRAGEYGLSSDAILGTPERKVQIVQEENPYEEDGTVKVLTVDIKPRWPWDSKVDIDFRVQTPEKSGTPVTVKFWGLNLEGGDLADDYPDLRYMKECAAKSGCYTGFSDNGSQTAASVEKTGDKMAYITCPTSGLYRFTWDMGTDWYNVSQASRNTTGLNSTENIWNDNAFHTPEFSVRVVASDATGANIGTNFASKAVRVDMRVNKLSPQAQDPYTSSIPAGGTILSGIERIGHPYGLVDPVMTNTTDEALFPSNGWNKLDFVELLPDAYTNRYDKACVINNAYIEGGTITNDTVWKADKVHVVRDNVFVSTNATLTIAPDAVVKFCESTHIFVRENAAAANYTAAKHNIIVQGAYFTYAYDQSYDGDTLYHVTRAPQNSLWNSPGRGIIYSPGSKVVTEEVCYQSTHVAHRAITRVALNEQWQQTLGAKVTSKSPYKYKFYSYEQPWLSLPPPSEEGCEFFGWFDSNPAGTSLLGDPPNPALYTNATKSLNHMIDLSAVPYASSRVKEIHALVCPKGWAESVFPAMDASGGTIRLDAETAVYDGKEHKPGVKEVRVLDQLVKAANYNVIYGDGNWTDAGEYGVMVKFTADYVNSPETTFRILKRSTAGATAELEWNEKMYVREKIDKPGVVKVTVPGMDSVPAKDYSVRWLGDAGARWWRPGTYQVEIAFDPNNYEGPAITNEVVITVNPDLVYKEYGSEGEAKTEIGKTPATNDGTRERRILYIGGNDMMTEYAKNVIKSDIELNDYIVDNFICWADTDVTSDAFKRYSEGLDYVAPPVIAVLSKRDTSRYIDRITGYVTAEELLAFLEDALAAPEDASSATLTLAKTEYTWTGTTISPPDGTVKVKFAGDTIDDSNYSLVYSSGTRTDVGEYTVKAVFEGSLYSGETEEVAFRIVPAALAAGDITLTPASAVYNGEYQRPEVTVAGGIDYTVSWGAGDWTKAGTYSLTVTASGNHTGSVTKNFTIAKAAVSGAVIELDSGYLEVSEDKMPSSPVKPAILSVHDAARTYLEGTDYTIDWGDDAGYMTAGTNIITATFKGNYSGTATTNFIIEVAVKAATPEFDPASGTGVEVDAANAGEATSKVVIAVPSAVAAYVDAATYQTYFKKTATKDPTTGKWIVTAEIDKAVVLPATMTIGAKTALLEEHIIDAVLGTSEEPVFAAVPGMWYTLLGSATPSFGVSTGTPRMATGDSVALPKPKISGPKAFFKLRVKATEE
ncbi:MAG: hypothetical protein J6P13_07330 [Kiritimatiellae bacterium]|nr:hypothetical protein [Kiritimatiellia bacterium]